MEIHGLFSVQIFLLLVITILQNGCDGFCFVGQLMAEMTVSRRLRYYCDYKGTDGHSMKLFPGSNLQLVDQCLDCKCTMDGLQCCGFGYAGGTLAIKKECKLLLDGCQALIVKKDNQTLDCFTNKPINFTALSEQLPHPDNTYTSLNIRKPIPSTILPVPITTTIAAGTTTIAAAATTTTVSPLNTKTTTPKPRRMSRTNILAPTLSDYFRYLMLVGSPVSNQARAPPFLQYWDAANTFESVSTEGSLNKRRPIPTTTVPLPTAATTTTTTTTAAPITTKTTTPNPRPAIQDSNLSPTMSDYFRFLMLARNSAPNQAHAPQFLPYWNTGNTLQSLPDPATQHAPLTNNFWQYDYILPFFLSV